MRGGYLGVDVFFVISGFLITSRLIRDLQTGNLSLRAFYDNRARRILPSLLLVVILTTVAGCFLLLPYSLKNVGQSVVATLLSANNFLLYITSGYWNTAADFKPLYHTWSLAVEEQFYFLSPLAIVVIYKLTRGRRAFVTFALAISAVASFICATLAPDREFVFLMLLTRAWELLAGAMLVMLDPPKHARRWFPWLGLGLLLLSYWQPFPLTHYQSAAAAVAVIATCIIIRYTDSRSLLVTVMSFKPLAVIGLTSYSIYLWHQPLLAYFRAVCATEPSSTALVAVALLSIPMAYFSWRWVENPARNRAIAPKKLFYSTVVISGGICLAFAAIIAKTYGLQSLWPQYAYGINPQLYVDEPRSLAAEHFHAGNRPKVLVVGNSFARDYINMLRENGIAEREDIVYTDDPCKADIGPVIAKLARDAELIIVSKNWSESTDGDAVSEALRCYRNLSAGSAAPVYVLGSKNFGWNNNFVRTRSIPLGDLWVHPEVGVTRFNATMKATLGDHFVDVLGVVADSRGAVPVFTPGMRLITYDTDHLTRAGAQFVGARLFARYAKLAPV